MFVEPGIWRQGVGQKLVDYCASAARKLAADRELHVVGEVILMPLLGVELSCGSLCRQALRKLRFGPGLLFEKTVSGRVVPNYSFVQKRTAATGRGTLSCVARQRPLNSSVEAL